MSNDIESDFPNLIGKEFRVLKKSESIKYNYHAYSLEIYDEWCGSSQKNWPHDKIDRSPSLENYIKYFNLHGYNMCEDDSLEERYDKIALYVNKNNNVTHSCRQFGELWRSKLGPGGILEHKLEWICGDIYGNIGCIMKRKSKY
jgi:hypothetical protein